MVRVRQPLHPRRRMGIKMKWLLGGGAAMILMDVHLTNKVSVPSVPNHEHVQLIALQLDRKVPDSSRRSIPGTFNALSNRSTTRLGVLPAADSLAEHAGNVVPIQRKGYPLPTNSSIVSSEGIKALKMLSYWGNNKFCRDIRRPRPSLQPMVFNITFGCQELFSVSGMGTGNWMSALYGIRMAALTNGGVGVRFTCPDAEEKKRDLIIPWLMGYFPEHDVSLHGNLTLPTVKDACAEYEKCPIGHMIPFMRRELRRMAIALVGIPREDHPSREYADRLLWSSHEQSENIMQIPAPSKGASPLHPDVELDDVTIHFRCGDIINSDHPSFGFMKFSAYTRLISPDIESIGIITQPFERTNQSRYFDATENKRKKCKELVTAFDERLSASFPKARIRIHNGPNETIALAYARMIMAKQTIVGIGTFGVFPALATFGTGYIRKPDYAIAPNRWLLYPPADELYDNVVLFEEPNRLMTYQVKQLRKLPGRDENVLEWFRNDTYCIDKCITTSRAL